MLCEKCGKNKATTHIRSVINGLVKEVSLCSECAANEGYGKFEQNSLMDMLSSMLSDTILKEKAISEEMCPCCKATFSQIAATGRTGCPMCYEKFRSQLLPYIKRMHGGTNHIGKKPSREQLIVSPTDKITQLRKKLSELVKNEKYEEAAVIRDEIKKYEGPNQNH